ncbi:hypothetical protein [Nocardiopsis sp. NRRL B-16309]|uniref:hypothetical protein n=1 Tax=Nocardiopsis sp. NRRL B-16309 TaxID=1519494 RepID=UPI0006AEB120|nr:hypothetical protein [Nocardiopsis sp. NRRL B-16309]KOX11010.1 hypothetical protein ADL05_24400 [Nocardiopsis sp. NRRL B-16309]
MKRSITLDPRVREQLRALTPLVRVRAGDALLELAAADDPDELAIGHPEYPDDPYIRQLRGLGFVMTVLFYDHRVVALTVHTDG